MDTDDQDPTTPLILQEGGLQDKRALIELPPKAAADDILLAVRKILAKSGVTRITIRGRQPIEVLWQGTAEDTLDFDLPDITLKELLPELELVELPLTKNPAYALGRVSLWLLMQGLEPSHCLVGPRSILWQWLNVDFSGAEIVLPRRLYGAVQTDVSLPPDVLLMLGAPSALSPLRDVQAGAKVTMVLP